MAQLSPLATLNTRISEPVDSTQNTIAFISSDQTCDAPGGVHEVNTPEIVTTTVDNLTPEHDTPSREQERAEHLKLAHRRATATFETVVESLVGLIDVPLTAYLSNVNETRAVRQWLSGERVPHPATQTKLQLALQVAAFLDAEGEGEVIAAWFQGLNPALDDQAPADLIRVAGADELSSIARRVLAAAKEFVDN
jgi:hypothetical protein